VELREALDVHFVEQCVGERRVRRPVAAPVVAVGNDARLQSFFDAADDLARVRVEQDLRRVEAMPGLGLPGPVRAKGVDEAGSRAGEASVADIAAARR
jgi:hypothetical protein